MTLPIVKHRHSDYNAEHIPIADFSTWVIRELMKVPFADSL